jgi:hypothetical protein
MLSAYYRLMLGWLVNNEIESVRKEVVLVHVNYLEEQGRMAKNLGE